VQKGMAAQKASAREKLYLAAVAELYKDAGAGTRESTTSAIGMRWQQPTTKYPDDETKLFYGLSILGAIPGDSLDFNNSAVKPLSRSCHREMRLTVWAALTQVFGPTESWCIVS
jgi:hypothetical protein